MTDLSYEATWDSVICLEDWLSPNKYTAKIYFDIETDSGDHQNIAFERCKIFVETLMHNSLLINMDNPLVQTLHKTTKQKIITLPNEPLDVIIAAILYHKLNAISEGNMIINQIKIKSDQGDNVWVHFDEDFAMAFGSLENSMYEKINSEKPWWYRPDASSCDWFEIKKKEVKFHLHKVAWDKSLSWDTDEDNKKSNLLWKPHVIDGGKSKH